MEMECAAGRQEQVRKNRVGGGGGGGVKATCYLSNFYKVVKGCGLSPGTLTCNYENISGFNIDISCMYCVSGTDPATWNGGYT